jgi:hypothetical protein
MGYKFKFCPTENCCELTRYIFVPFPTYCPICGEELLEEYQESPEELGMDLGGVNIDDY